MKMKECRKCNEILPLTDFYKDKQSSDGKRNRCKYCDKIYVSAYNKKTDRIKVYKARASASEESIADMKRYLSWANENLPKAIFKKNLTGKKWVGIDFNAPIKAEEFEDRLGDEEIIDAYKLKGNIPAEWRNRHKVVFRYRNK